MVTITVCIGSSCHIKGSYDVVTGLQKLVKDKNLEDQVTIKASFCLGNCTKPVSAKINDGPVISIDKDNIEGFFNNEILTLIKN